MMNKEVRQRRALADVVILSFRDRASTAVSMGRTPHLSQLNTASSAVNANTFITASDKATA